MDPSVAIDQLFAVLGAPEHVNVGFLRFDLRQKFIDGINASVEAHGIASVLKAMADGVNAAVALSAPTQVPSFPPPFPSQPNTAASAPNIWPSSASAVPVR